MSLSTLTASAVQVFCPAVIINEHLYEVRIIDCPYIPYFPVSSLYEWTDFRGYGLRNATAYILVYDITSEDSFQYIKNIREQILESRDMHDVPIFVVRRSSCNVHGQPG